MLVCGLSILYMGAVWVSCVSMGDVQVCDIHVYVHTSARVSKRAGCAFALEVDMLWVFLRASVSMSATAGGHGCAYHRVGEGGLDTQHPSHQALGVSGEQEGHETCGQRACYRVVSEGAGGPQTVACLPTPGQCLQAAPGSDGEPARQ